MPLRLFKRDRTFRQPVVWITTFVIVAFHFGALAALFVFSWKAFMVAMCCGGSPEVLASGSDTIAC